MTARPNDADRRPAAAPADTPPGGAADSSPATGSPRPPGVPPELRDHPTYEVLKELGHGGMGAVYLARNRPMDRLEVLKVLQPRLATHADLHQRFVQEVRMAARLQHPHIVVAYGTFAAGEALVLAMEHVDGVSLHELVVRQASIDG